MAANLQPITSDGGFTSGGNINSSGDPSSAPSLNDFFSITSAANFAIVTDNANTDQTWTFDDAGNLTLPGNTFAVNYANGTQVSIGGGGNANTGNVTFDDNIVIGTGDEFGSAGLFLAPGNGSIANSAVQYLRVRGGDAPTHIHLDTGNNQFYDQYFGDDAKYVKLELGDAGNVVIGTDDANGNQYSWSFTSDGNLILAGGESVIQSVANSSLDPINPNVSTMILTPDQGYSSQSLVLDPTAPGHIHLRAPGANIDEPLANIFLGGEESSFEVGYYNGSAPNVYIHSGNNTWTFDTAGTLVFPRDTDPNTADPILTIVGGGNPSISSIDASLAGPANLGISALTTTFTGFTGDAIKIYPDDGEISSTANLQIWANSGGNTEYSWTFDTTGNLTLPDTTSVLANVSITLEANDTGNITGLSVIGDSHANLYAHGNITLYANTGGAGSTWTFDNSGTLTLPQGSQISETANTSVNITANANTWAFGVNGNLTLPNSATIIAPNVNDLTLRVIGEYNICTIQNAGSGYSGSTPLPTTTTGGTGSGMTVNFGYGISGQLVSVSVSDPGTGYSEGDVIGVDGGSGTFVITKYNSSANQANNNTAPTDWTFGVDGNITLPNNYSSINYANGSPYGGGGGNTGNVTFNDINIIGNGNLKLQPDSANANAYLDIFLTAGPDIHIAGNGETVILGTDDFANVAVNVDGNVSIQAGNVSGTKTWTFDPAGNLTTPSNLVIGPGPGSGSSIFQYNEGLQILGEGANSVVQMGWTANTSAPDSVATIAMNYPSGGEGNILIAVGNNATTVNYWLFDNTGNLRLPGNTFAVNYANGTAVTIPTVGNIATINLDGSNTNVLYGNGIFAAIPAPTVAQDISSNGAMSIMTYDGNLKYVNNATVEPSTGNIAGGNISTTGAVTANIANITTGNITTINSGLLQNGNSNITITSNGNVSIQAAGSNVELVVTSTGANITGTLDATGNITGGNISTSGNVSAGNVIINGQTLIATGTVATNYLATTRTGTNQTFTSAGDVILNTTDQSVGSSVTYNTGTGVYTLVAGTTYELSFTPSWTFSGSSNDAYVQYDWVDASTNTALDGNSGSAATAYSYQYNFAQHNFNIISKLVYTPSTNQTVKVRVTGTQAGGITTTLATGSSAYVKAMNAIFALDAIDTMTTTGNVTVGGNLTVTGNISGNTNGFTIGYLNIPQVSAANATLALTDAGKHYYSTTAGNLTLTIPTNANVAFATGTAISIVVQAAGNILVNAASGVTLYMAGNSTAANRVVGGYGMATLMKVASDTWFINGAGVA